MLAWEWRVIMENVEWLYIIVRPTFFQAPDIAHPQKDKCISSPSPFSNHSKGQLIRDASVRNSGQNTSGATINVIIRPSYVVCFLFFPFPEAWLHPCIRVMQSRFFWFLVYFFHDLIITVGQYIKWSLILPLCCLSLGYDYLFVILFELFKNCLYNLFAFLRCRIISCRSCGSFVVAIFLCPCMLLHAASVRDEHHC